MTAEKACEQCPMEARIEILERGQKDTIDRLDKIIERMDDNRKELWGNGTLTAEGEQAGVFPTILRRLAALDKPKPALDLSSGILRALLIALGLLATVLGLDLGGVWK